MTRSARPGRSGQAGLRLIERYRHSRLSRAGAGCRFEPSCSHYAEQVLRTRPFAVAAALIAWRLVRCNPLAVHRLPDPVQRTRRFTPRPNALPTIFAMFALAGFVVVMTAATAQAVGDTGGCDPRIDGVHPSFMEQDRALPIAKHEVVEVTGRVPSEFRSPSVTTTTHIDVDFVTGVFGASSSDHPGTGPAVRDSVQADDYLKYGVGLYHVWAVVKGDGWNCLADGYVRLEDGSPLSHPVGEVAGGLTVVSATGIFISARWRRYYGYVAADYEDPPAVVKADAEVRANEDAKRGSALVTDAPTAAGAAVGCILLLLVATFAAHSLDTAVKAAAVPAVRRRAGRYWVRGHVVPATISGLFLGIGVTVLLQQYAYWPLTVVTAFVFPPVVAIIAGLWAHIGTPMKPVKAEAASPSS